MNVFSTKTSAIALTLVTGIAAPSFAYACDDHENVTNTSGYNSIVAANYTETTLGAGQQLAYALQPAQPNPNVRYRPGSPCDQLQKAQANQVIRSNAPVYQTAAQTAPAYQAPAQPLYTPNAAQYTQAPVFQQQIQHASSPRVVYIDRPVDRPVYIERRVPVDRPVYVEKRIPVPVDRPVHVDRPVPVDRPVYVEKRISVPVPVDRPVYVNRPVPASAHFGPGGAPAYDYGTSFGAPNFGPQASYNPQGSWGQSGWGGIAPANWGQPQSNAGTTVQWFAGRISRLSGRIAENENKGRLTPADASHLRVQLQEVSNLLDKARKDSVIDNGEAKKISTRLNGLSDGLKQRGLAAPEPVSSGLAPAYPTVGLPSTPGYTEHTLGGYEFGAAPTYGTSFGAPSFGPTPWATQAPLSAQWGMPAAPSAY